ncbi:MAG: hypothetical protein J6Y56_03580 [Fibrobacterales bacterium]|nr:hypothetical protein [Fibrobacterales bacterium]
MENGENRRSPRALLPGLAAAALLLALLALIAAQSKLYGREIDDINPETKFDYLPDVETVRLLAPGHQGALGRAFWIRAATYFGGESLGGRKATWMLHLCALVTKLAPKFDWPYQIIGTSVFDDEGDLDIEQMRQGIREIPDNLHIHMFLAMRLVEKHGDYQGAGEVLDHAIANADVPDFVRGMRETYRKNENDLPQAMAIYLGEWERVKDNLQMAKPVLERLARMIDVKKNKASDLDLKKIKERTKLLEEQKISAQEFYGEMMRLALPPEPAPEAEPAPAAESAAS